MSADELGGRVVRIPLSPAGKAFNDLMRDHALASIDSMRAMYGESPLLAELERHAGERKRADDEYLAGLDERERTFVLRMRRWKALDDRFRQALDFSRCDCGDGCW